jgi:DNA-binding NtrC family response regulator
MPGMSATDVVEKMVDLRPTLKVIFMSGYTDHVIARHGLLDPRLPFLQKPFAPDRLAHKIREVLDQQSDRAWTGRPDPAADRQKA